MTSGEAYSLTLRTLFSSYGYQPYRMSKFEEYDLYARNKDFLISDSVITFTDGSGKLLALKPDVTLSIVKNADLTTGGIKKLYYDENVYRVAKGSRSFKEIPQIGLECLGKVDDHCLYEVLSLALTSLEKINASHVLSVSHLGLLTEAMDFCGVPEEARGKALQFLGEKNLHELSSLLSSLGITDEKAEVLKKLLRAEGPMKEILPFLRSLLSGIVKQETLQSFLAVLSCFEDEPSLRVDFSVVGDIHYYNGLIFKGFAENVPTAILSGGQYDTLMQKLSRRASAIGFAVYLDVLEQSAVTSGEYDADVLLLYSPADPLAAVEKAAKKLREEGKTVLMEPEIPGNIRYKDLMTFKDQEVKPL